MNPSTQGLYALANADATAFAIVNQLAAAEIVDTLDELLADNDEALDELEQIDAENDHYVSTLLELSDKLFDALANPPVSSEGCEKFIREQIRLVHQGLSALSLPALPAAIDFKHNPDPDLLFGEMAEVDTSDSYEAELENEIDRQSAIIDDLRAELRGAYALGQRAA